MKRSEALRALSHEHHQGLFAALQLKRARQDSAAEARSVFLDFFERIRVLTEHIDLRRRALDLEASPDPDPAELRELGERLESHIRFEERVLFPMIEEALPVDELERLGAAFARAEAEHE